MVLNEERIRSDLAELVQKNRRAGYLPTGAVILLMIGCIMIVAGLLANTILREMRLSGAALILAYVIVGLVECLILVVSILLTVMDYRKKKRQFEQKKQQRLAMIHTAPYRTEVLHCVKKEYHKPDPTNEGDISAHYLYFAERQGRKSVLQTTFDLMEVGDQLYLAYLTEDTGVRTLYLEKAEMPGHFQQIRDEACMLQLMA